MFTSRFMPCPDCGASIDTTVASPHRCDPERLLDHRMFALRDEIDAFDSLLTLFLDSSEGRLEAWLACRQVRRAT